MTLLSVNKINKTKIVNNIFKTLVGCFHGKPLGVGEFWALTDYIRFKDTSFRAF